MDSAAASAFLRDQVPVAQQVLLPPILKAAHAAVTATVNEVPFLRTPSATYNRGRLLSWAVDLAVEGHIKSGHWNVDYRWASFGFPKPTGKYLEVLPSHSRITISQIVDDSKQPRNVNFRENARLFNGPLLFEEMQEAAEISGRPSFLMIYDRDLSFLRFAMPHATRKYGYICKTRNLMTLPQEVPLPGPLVEDTSFEETTMTLKDQIAKWLKDHGG
jgi:hypothetical protein